MSYFTIWLFGKPEWELDEVSHQSIKDLGDEIQDRLSNVSKIVKQLESDGWKMDMQLYDIGCSHEDTLTFDELQERLVNLGVDVEFLGLDEDYYNDSNEDLFEEEEDLDG